MTSSNAMSTVTSQTKLTVQRHTNVTGDQGKQNDLILSYTHGKIKTAVIFFGGDVQVTVHNVICFVKIRLS